MLVVGAQQRGVCLRELLTDLYARSLIILELFGAQFVRLTPLWLAGVWLGATLAWFLAPRFDHWRAWHVVRHPAKRPVWGLLLGSCLGLLSPFSLLSLIGLLRELGRESRLRPWVVGFTLASPLLDPTMFTFTLLALGPRLAGLRIFVALLAAWLAGVIILRRLPSPSDDGVATDQAARALSARTTIGYMRHLGQHVLFSGRHYLLALLLTAWIQVLLPLRSWLSVGSSGGVVEVLLSAALGVPLYVCGGGAIALADGLMRSGLSQGAVLAYLMMGAVTTPRALTGLLALLGKRGTAILIAAVLGTAVLGGMLLNTLT